MPFSNLRNQKATLWTKSGLDAAGDPSWNSPVMLFVRWEVKEELVTNADGTQRKGTGVVWLDRDADFGDMLYLGTSSSASPNDVDGAERVISFTKIPSVDGLNFERKVVVA